MCMSATYLDSDKNLLLFMHHGDGDGGGGAPIWHGRCCEALVGKVFP